MNEAQKFLMDKKLNDRVISHEHAETFYVSDAMTLFKAEKDAGAKLACSDGLVAPVVDHEMLTRAMKKAVEVGIFPKHPVDSDTYLKHWNGMMEVLHTAVGN